MAVGSSEGNAGYPIKSEQVGRRLARVWHFSSFMFGLRSTQNRSTWFYIVQKVAKYPELTCLSSFDCFPTACALGMVSTRLSVSESTEKLLSTANKLTTKGKLSDGQANRVAVAATTLATDQPTERGKRYKSFLRDMLSECGPAALLVCAAGLGQVRAATLRTSERAELRQNIMANAGIIIHPTILAIAAANNIPKTLDDIVPLNPDDYDSEFQEPPHKRRRVLQAGLPDTPYAYIPGMQDTHVTENATIEGTTAVFGERMCRAIRKIPAAAGIPSKAAVTMVTPKWGEPGDFLVTLSIVAEEVDKLALALFKTRLVWTQRDLHVIMRDGFTVTLSSSEARVTLKGATDKSIIEVLGGGTCNAVNESATRLQEVSEGRLLTECVSMILTKKGAILSVLLGRESGLGIQDILYAETLTTP